MSKVKAVVLIIAIICFTLCMSMFLYSCGKSSSIQMYEAPQDGPEHAYFKVVDNFDSDYYICQLSSHSYSACPEKNHYEGGDMVIVSTTEELTVGSCYEIENPEVVGSYRSTPDAVDSTEVIRGTKFNKIQ